MEWASNVSWSVVSSIGATIATALATVVLVAVTWVLAKETKRLADATSAPHVVASLDPSPWSVIHTNLVLQNAGTGTAYEIEVAFDPPLKIEKQRGQIEMASRSLSVLKPNQTFAVFLHGFENLSDKIVDVKVSWLRSPQSKVREVHSYRLDLVRDYEDWGQLGGGPPLIEISKDIRKLREEVSKLARKI